MDITQWSASEVRQALEAEGFETDICDTFLDQGIDGSLIKGINSGDLAEMGLTLKLGPKKRLLSFLHNIGQSANNPDKVRSENLNASCSSQAETANTNPEKVCSENLNASCSSQAETANTNPEKVRSENLNASCSSQAETANTNPDKVRSENLNVTCSSTLRESQCTGSLAQPLNFFLVIEGSLVPLGQNSSIAFNLHYPPYIKPLFHFFEQRVVQIASMSASTADFISKEESKRVKGYMRYSI
uniref:SAM domain-containing protein n=1 Tax=Daphnia galeata TaxID=27404 RepID=A0A8J2RLX4_9CRUS|nr:unnamed protein product [Daphnia galeata]